MTQSIILSHLEDIKDQSGADWRTWDAFEDRFEPNELKWISDYIVRNLVFVRTELSINDPDTTSHILQALWKTLDLLNEEAS